MIQKLSYLIITLLFCQACQRTERTTILRKSPEVIPAAESGTVDSGGGNGTGNMPLESFKKNPLEQPEVTTLVLPILRNLAIADQEMASKLYHILVKRAWYFVPARLNTIPEVVLGVSFPNEQYALQNQKEIWIDSEKYQAMSFSAQATLILHELVMGLRVLQFNSDLDVCLSSTHSSELFRNKKSLEDAEAGELCRKSNPLDQLRSRSLFSTLNATDYAQVRQVTSSLAACKGEISKQALAELLDSNPIWSKTIQSKP